MKKVFLVLAGCFIIITIATGILLPRYIYSVVSRKLASLEIHTDSLVVNFWQRSIAVINLNWHSTRDSSQNEHVVRVKHAVVKGINLYDLVFHQSYNVDEIMLDSGFISYNQSIINQNDSTHQAKPLDITFKNIRIKEVVFQLKSDTTTNLSVTVNTSLADVHTRIDQQNISYSVGALDFDANDLNINRHTGTHGVHASKVSYHSIQEKAVLDSVMVIPNYGKLEIGRHFKEQKSRIELVVPQINIEGLALNKMIDSTISASRIEIQSFNVSAFKDKRLPFHKETNVPMPMESFLNIPIHINVDSIIIKNSNITIEEIPENGSQSINVTFKKVNGKFAGLNNRISTGDSTNAILYADGLLMGIGKVDAIFTFPLDGTPHYSAIGSIKNMPFSELNQPLINAAKIQVKSGYLNKLAFNFKYDENVSVGKIVIDYEDLKITGLTKEKEIDELKTMLINLFVKNNKSKDLPKIERTGLINVERDKKKFIFNFWWKSILGGLKSSILGEKADKLDHSKMSSSKE